MSPLFFFKGILIGISMAAPVGPIGILCIKRSLTRGYWAGFATGLGAALADLIYALMAGFGLTAISSFLITQQPLLYVIGGFILLILGIRTLFSNSVTHNMPPVGKSFLKTVIETMFLTLTNPLTIMAFLAGFAAIGFTQEVHDYGTAILLCLGVFLGSTLWFTVLSFFVSIFRSKCTPNTIKYINTLSGLFLVAIGTFLIGNFFLFNPH